MNKIDMNAVLPKAPAPAPKARSGNLFQEQIGLGTNATGNATADASLTPPEAGGKKDGNPRKQSMVSRDVELYSLAALAQHHLSYARDMQEPELPLPVMAGVDVAAAHEVPSFSASSPAALQTAALEMPRAQIGPGSVRALTVADAEGEGAASPAGLMVLPEELSARYPRRVSLFRTAGGGIEAVVRDYEGDSGELLAQIQLHCSHHDISLTRITVNGTVLWSTPSAN